MLERKDVMPISFLKKENFTGSSNGMRFRMEKSSLEEENVLLVTAWPEPYCYEATPDEQKVKETFPFTKEGILGGVKWLNSQQNKL